MSGRKSKMTEWQTEPSTEKTLKQLTALPSVVLDWLKDQNEEVIPTESNNEEIESQLMKMFGSEISTPKLHKSITKPKKSNKEEKIRDLVIRLFGSPLDDVPTITKKVSPIKRRRTLPISIPLSCAGLKLSSTPKRKSETDLLRQKLSTVSNATVETLSVEYTNASELIVPPIFKDIVSVLEIAEREMFKAESAPIVRVEEKSQTIKTIPVMEFSEQARVLVTKALSMPLLSPDVPSPQTEAVLPQSSAEVVKTVSLRKERIKRTPRRNTTENVQIQDNNIVVWANNMPIKIIPLRGPSEMENQRQTTVIQQTPRVYGSPRNPISTQQTTISTEFQAQNPLVNRLLSTIPVQRLIPPPAPPAPQQPILNQNAVLQQRAIEQNPRPLVILSSKASTGPSPKQVVPQQKVGGKRGPIRDRTLNVKRRMLQNGGEAQQAIRPPPLPIFNNFVSPPNVTLPHLSRLTNYKVISTSVLAEKILRWMIKIHKWNTSIMKFYEELGQFLNADELKRGFNRLNVANDITIKEFVESMILELREFDVEELSMGELVSKLGYGLGCGNSSASKRSVCTFLWKLMRTVQDKCSTPFLKKLYMHVEQAKLKLDEMDRAKVAIFMPNQLVQLKFQIQTFCLFDIWLKREQLKQQTFINTHQNNVHLSTISKNLQLQSRVNNNHSTPIVQPIHIAQQTPPSQEKQSQTLAEEEDFDVKIIEDGPLPIPKNLKSEGEAEKKEVIDLTWLEDDIENDDDAEIIECKMFPFKFDDSDEDSDTPSNRENASPADSGLGSPAAQIENESTYKCLCGSKALYVCACNASMYCSLECQALDWIYHQTLCQKKKS